MRPVGAIIGQIAEGYAIFGGGWVRISKIAITQNITPEEIRVAILDLMDDEDFRAEPEPFGFRITAEDRKYGPMIGGEARHLIWWG